MTTEIWVPIVVVLYFVIMIWYSTIMAKVLNTNLVILIIVGLFFPPLWAIMAIVSLSYQYGGSSNKKSEVSPKTSPKKSPTKKSKK